jgi:uncharacterized membrane protein
MSELIVAVYPHEQRASAVLASLQQEHIIAPHNLNDAVSVMRSRDGAVKLHQRLDQAGVLEDAFWRMLIGFLFLTPSAGVGAEASAGSPSTTFADYGIDEDFVQELDSRMAPTSSAVFVLVWGSTPDMVFEDVSKFGGTMLRTGLGKQADVRLRAAQT